MTSSVPLHSLEFLDPDIIEFLNQLPKHKHGKLIERALGVIARISHDEVDRLDWKILTASLEDLERGFDTFYPYRHTRKVTVFGSARIAPGTKEYQMAMNFARHISQQGYMVMTGAGGGIMAAGNEGAGRENSFGLNIELPFEQDTNPYIANDPKLISFKYFFTRKLFLLKESDALAVFPGGFGTQDETFETLTLCQTGKYGPVPLVLIDKPGGDYWHHWNEYIKQQLVGRGLVSPEDPCLYTITDRLDVACETINNFYRIYHSSRYVDDLFVIRLKSALSDTEVEQLNEDFSDILIKGRIEKSRALPAEEKDETVNLPRIVLYFNQRDFGRLYQLINQINRMEEAITETHPEQK
jgi:uncharacterized protein (TIGR00730 family)